MAAPHNRQRLALATLVVALGLAVPTVASAATIPAAPATEYNSTPDCPVSATDTVCVWNVPADANSIFTAQDYGQCPYWAAEKYPALVRDEPASDPLGNDWDGGTWAEHAKAEGLQTSTTPAPGDLAVWQSGSSDHVGHVAYVEAVDGSAIIVSQMDGDSSAPFPAMQGSTEYIPAAGLAYFAHNYRLEYIVTGDGSSTPLSHVEQPQPPTSAATTLTVGSLGVISSAGSAAPSV